MGKEVFWATFTEYKFHEWYCSCYRDRANRLDGCIAAFCILTSLSSIAAWGFWKSIPVVWSIIIAVSQIVQALRPLYPFSKQISAFKYFIPQLRTLLVDMEHDWLLLDTYSDEKIADILWQYQKQYEQLDNRYLQGIHFPINEKCIEKATKPYLDYFSHKYQTGGDTNGKQEPAASTTTFSTASH